MVGTDDPAGMPPLTPAVIHVLLALASGEKHGYAIMQEVAAQTDGAVRMGPGTLYGSVKRMLAAGLIEEAGQRRDPVLGDERRKYYRLTSLGERTLDAELRRLQALLRLPAARRRMGLEGGGG